LVKGIFDETKLYCRSMTFRELDEGVKKPGGGRKMTCVN